MFVQTSSNNVQKRSTSTSDVTGGGNIVNRNSDELMFELEDISKFCTTARTSEVQELALDVVSKMVESWLDPNNIIQDKPCTCADDVLDHISKFGNTTAGPNRNNPTTYKQPTNQKPPEKRSNGAHDSNQSEGATGNFNEKRPRCNTGDKTASRSPNQPRDVDCQTREVPSEYFDLVALHLPIILRLCLACPFGKVREKCQGIFDVVRVSFFRSFFLGNFY